MAWDWIFQKTSLCSHLPRANLRDGHGAGRDCGYWDLGEVALTTHPQVCEKESACVGSEKDSILEYRAASKDVVIFILPWVPSLYNFLASVFGSSRSCWDSAPVRGRQPLGTELRGFDRAGRHTQHTKSSGPFEMSRQEARLREKQGYSPHAGAQRLPGRLLPLFQEPRGRVLGRLSASSGHIFTEGKGVPCPRPSAAGVCQVR